MIIVTSINELKDIENKYKDLTINYLCLNLRN